MFFFQFYDLMGFNKNGTYSPVCKFIQFVLIFLFHFCVYFIKIMKKWGHVGQKTKSIKFRLDLSRSFEYMPTLAYPWQIKILEDKLRKEDF